MMKTKYFVMMMIVAGLFSIAAKTVLPADDILGIWKYRISDVPPEYESGFFTFEQKDNKTVGFVGETEKQELKDLVVDQGKVSFAMDFDGSLIKYTLVQSGDTLSGTVSSQYGDFPIKAIKEPKK